MIEAIDWADAREIFNKDSTSLKDYISEHIHYPIGGTLKAAQYIIETCPTDIMSENSFRLMVVRSMYQTTPKKVLAKLEIGSNCINWIVKLLLTAQNDSALNASLRGLAMSVASSIIKYSLSLQPDSLSLIANGISFCLKCALESFPLYSSTESKDFVVDASLSMAGAIILHQMADFLLSIRDVKGQWLVPLFSLIPDITRIVSNCSSLQNQPQVHVDAAKAFGILIELYFINKSDIDEFPREPKFLEDLHLALHAIVWSICNCSILHNSYCNAFQSGVKLFRNSGDLDNSSFNLQCENMFFSLLERLSKEIDSNQLEHPMSLRRIELCQTLAGHLFEFNSLPYKFDVENGAAIISNTITTIISLQKRMKGLFIKKNTSDTDKSVSIKDLKLCCSEVRKSSIFALDLLLKASPSWIRSNYDKYWEICIRDLSTPRLFSAGYVAYSGTESEASFYLSTATFLREALAHIDRYSGSAAADIIASINDMFKYSKIYMIGTVPNDAYTASYEWMIQLANLLISSFGKCPKITSSNNTNSSNSKSVAPSSKSDIEVTDLCDWKIILNNTLKGIFESLIVSDLIAVPNPLQEVINALVAPECSDHFFAQMTSCTTLAHKILGNTPGPKGLGSAGNALKATNQTGMQLFGSVDPESISSLLLAYSQCLLSYLEVCLTVGVSAIVPASEESKDQLSSLLLYLESIANRTVFFQDDAEQLCHDAMIIAKGALYLSLSLPKTIDGSAAASGNSYFLPAVKAILGIVCMCGHSNTTDGPDGSEPSQDVEVTGVEQQHQQVVYEAAREALLYLLDNAISGDQWASLAYPSLKMKLPPASEASQAGVFTSLKNRGFAKKFMKELLDFITPYSVSA